MMDPAREYNLKREGKPTDSRAVERTKNGKEKIALFNPQCWPFTWVDFNGFSRQGIFFL